MEPTVNQSANIATLAKALSEAQGKIKGAAKDAENPFFKSKYADLASVWDACREQLSAAGLSVIQTLDGGMMGVTVVTTLAHSSGEWIRGSLTLKPVKDDPQGIGSAITYGRRYALAAMVGVAPEDDDGEGASGREKKGAPIKGQATDPPKPADPESWKADAEIIKNAIGQAKDVATLNATIKANGAALANIKVHSVTAYDFLMDRSAKRRGVLAQEPPR